MAPSSELKMRVSQCDKHGAYESARLFADRWTGCPTCAKDEREKEDQIRRESEHREFVWQATQRSGTLGRFAEARLASFIPSTAEQRKALATAEEFAAQAQAGVWAGLILIGPPGTGKTHLAAGICHAVIARGESARYATLRDLIREIRSTWHRGAEKTEAEVIEDFASFGLLAIDEVGIGAGTESELAHFFDVIDRRYQLRRPVVLVSNLGVPGLRQALGERLYDRLREGAKVLPCSWPSHRGANHG